MSRFVSGQKPSVSVTISISAIIISWRDFATQA
jgi:hypothetical protein